MLFARQRGTKWLEENSLWIWTAAIALLGASVWRFAAQPSFWLDEAFVAVSLREYSPHAIFAPLEYGQIFPRLYLLAMGLMSKVLGYQIWVLRSLPFLSFVVATCFWARVLARRAKSHAVVALMAAFLFIGASSWLDQAIQLKQYTFDVALALIPFLVADEFFTNALKKGKSKPAIIALSPPCLLSYTYPLALGARLLAWYLFEGPRSGWRIHASSFLLLVSGVAASLVASWFTDHSFNVQMRASYLAYWSDCLLGTSMQQGVGSSMRLLAKFFWGWHGRQPLVTAGMVPLQILGVYSVIKRWRSRGELGINSNWGSRSLGALLLLSGVILASALSYYPICGRVVLFTQVHTQILAIEGMLMALAAWGARRATRIILYAFVVVVAFHSISEYTRFVRSEPAENLRPALAAMKPELADTVWVHPCSIAQVRSLPDRLPVNRVVFGSDQTRPSAGEICWVLWSHLGNDDCVLEFERLRSQARSWQVVHEGPARGLALAQF